MLRDGPSCTRHHHMSQRLGSGSRHLRVTTGGIAVVMDDNVLVRCTNRTRAALTAVMRSSSSRLVHNCSHDGHREHHRCHQQQCCPLLLRSATTLLLDRRPPALVLAFQQRPWVRRPPALLLSFPFPFLQQPRRVVSTLRCSTHYSRLYSLWGSDVYVVQLYEPASVGSPRARGPAAPARAFFPTALPALSRPGTWRWDSELLKVHVNKKGHELIARKYAALPHGASLPHSTASQCLTLPSGLQACNRTNQGRSHLHQAEAEAPPWVGLQPSAVHPVVLHPDLAASHFRLITGGGDTV